MRVRPGRALAVAIVGGVLVAGLAMLAAGIILLWINT
jgi:hypothetical protein